MECADMKDRMKSGKNITNDIIKYRLKSFLVSNI